MVFTACVIDQPHLYVQRQAHNAANNVQHAQQSYMICMLTQMATLTKHAESIFSSLIQEATKTNDRINSLAGRIENAFIIEQQAEEYVQTLSVEQLLEQNRASYAAAPNEAAQLFTTSTRPVPLEIVYARAKPAPNFQRVQPYMDEGQDAMKLYSNPGFFLDTWIEEQQRLREEAKRQRRERKKQRQQKRDSKATGADLSSVSVRRIQVVKYDPMTGEKIVTDGGPAKTETATLRTSTLNKYNSRIDLPAGQAPPPVQVQNRTMSFSEYPGTIRPGGSGMAPPPAPNVSIPPPVPSFNNQPYQQPYQPYQQPSYHQPPPPGPPAAPRAPAAPAPPPPPPPPGMDSAPLPPRAPGLGAALANAQLQHVEIKPKPVDARSNLLEGIKKGVALKSAQERTLPVQAEEPKKEAMSVAAILSRRIAVAGSDSDDADDDADDWD